MIKRALSSIKRQGCACFVIVLVALACVIVSLCAVSQAATQWISQRPWALTTGPIFKGRS